MDPYVESYFDDPVDILKSYLGYYLTKGGRRNNKTRKARRRGGARNAINHIEEYLIANSNAAKSMHANIDELEYFLQHIYFALPSTPNSPNIFLDLNSEKDDIPKGIDITYNYTPTESAVNINNNIIAQILNVAGERWISAEDVFNIIHKMRNANGIHNPYIIIFHACGDDSLISDSDITEIQRTMRDNHYTFLEEVSTIRMNPYERKLDPIYIGNPDLLHIPSDKEVFTMLNEIYEYNAASDIEFRIVKGFIFLYMPAPAPAPTSSKECYIVDIMGESDYHIITLIPVTDSAKKRISDSIPGPRQFNMMSSIAKHLNVLFPKVKVIMKTPQMLQGNSVYVCATINGPDKLHVIEFHAMDIGTTSLKI